jgi:cation diffusion facilitator CzcD-associated flavoprotein CzcO
MMAYKISQQCHNVEHVIYERNPSIGGTWFENRYPGCACDVPSHAYTFPFAPNASWPRFLATAADVLVYLEKVTTRLDLKKYIKLNHQVASCIWDDNKGKWKVKVEIVEPKMDWSSRESLKVVGTFEDEADVLLCATGPLNRWDLPDLEGLESFKGRASSR